MASRNDNDLDGLTQALLKKCEVSTLDQFYHKWVEDNDGSIPIKYVCSFHKNFNETKVVKDIDEIPDLLVINILDFTQKESLTREKFLINYIGLVKIIKSLRRLNILKKTTSLNEILSKLGIETEYSNKVIILLKKAISEPIIYANLIEHNEMLEQNNPTMVFYNKIKHPLHRGTFLKLIFTTVIAIATLAILLPIMIFINSQI